MVYIDLRSVVLIVVVTVNTSIFFFTCSAFMHCMALGAAWAYYNPETFLCPMIIFATFAAERNAQEVIAVTYMPPCFKVSVR
jgi:hypothetical protein